jgi:hypothetical protein
MKIIITEEQYNELNKVDDIYDGLNPYYRRRINFINIKSNIDERIGYRTAKVLKHDPRGLVGHFNDIIHLLFGIQFLMSGELIVRMIN